MEVNVGVARAKIGIRRPDGYIQGRTEKDCLYAVSSPDLKHSAKAHETERLREYTLSVRIEDLRIRYEERELLGKMHRDPLPPEFSIPPEDAKEKKIECKICLVRTDVRIEIDIDEDGEKEKYGTEETSPYKKFVHTPNMDEWHFFM